MKIRKILKKYPKVESVCRKIYYFFKMEPIIEEYDITSEKIKSLLLKENPVIIEIGCHDGENTEWFATKFSQPTIHCFEPDPRALQKFKKKFLGNNKIILHPFALGECRGQMKFYQSYKSDNNGEWDASGSLMAPKNHLKEYPFVKFESGLSVDVYSLDEICESNGIDSIDLIWMDVQGAELKVISGGIKSFQKARYIITEYSNKELY